MKRIEENDLTHDDLFEIAKIIKNPLVHDKKATVVKYKNQKWYFDCREVKNEAGELVFQQWEIGGFIMYPLISTYPSKVIIYTPDGKVRTWVPDEEVQKNFSESSNGREIEFKYLENPGIRDITEKLKESEIEDLVKLFHPQVIPPKDIKGIPLEVDNYIKDFGGNSWLTAPTKAYEMNTDAFILMENNVLKYFIAGFIKTIIEGSKSVVEEQFVHFVGSDDFMSFSEHLSKEQVKYIFDFTLKLCEAESCYRIIQDRIMDNCIKYEGRERKWT